jgi:LDH2 family malate/lactate/ureidoglycolate dehydrogenase
VAIGSIANGEAPSHRVVALKPLGGHKGQCLAMMAEILTSLLSGSAVGHTLSHFYDEPFTAPRKVSHFFLALDPAAFGDSRAFEERLSAFLAFIRSQSGLPGVTVRCPGDQELEMCAFRQRHGIPLGEPELSCIRQLQREEREIAAIESRTLVAGRHVR